MYLHQLLKVHYQKLLNLDKSLKSINVLYLEIIQLFYAKILILNVEFEKFLDWDAII